MGETAELVLGLDAGTTSIKAVLADRNGAIVASAGSDPIPTHAPDEGARVQRTADGVDVTAAFVSGARAALEAAPGVTHAVLKARSPSCGCGRTWIDGAVRSGDGVFAALLRRRGVTVQTDEEPLSAERPAAGRGPGVRGP